MVVGQVRAGGFVAKFSDGKLPVESLINLATWSISEIDASGNFSWLDLWEMGFGFGGKLSD